MVKVKKVFFCSNCGNEFPKWMGRCPVCNEWNSFKEEIVHKDQKNSVSDKLKRRQNAKPTPLSEITADASYRMATHDHELNRVLGGGIMAGSIVLVGGQPGIGKSTLLLQLALQNPIKVLYVSGEESEVQIKTRADRLSGKNSECLIYTEVDVESIIDQARKTEAMLLVVDSIQTVSVSHIDAAPGSVSQIRESTAVLQQYAKESGVPVFLIGHITKDGQIAGPKLLEHMVDVVLQFEGDRHHVYRILRTTKNRFGSTDEIGIYAMETDGLRQVENPSELLISPNTDSLSGSAICASVEGQRPLLIESQALVTPSVYGNPQRSATGFDLRRMSMVLAVLEKRCGLPFGMHDVFLNIAGGLKISDPGADLGIIAALISSIRDMDIDKKCCFAGEIGLSGEVRAVSRIEQRVQEADRLGFTSIYVPEANLKALGSGKYEITIHPISRVDQLVEDFFN